MPTCRWRDLASELTWPLPTQTTETVEKWALRHWGHVPHTGEQIDIENFQVTATEVTLRRVLRPPSALVRKPAPVPADPDAEPAEEAACLIFNERL